MHGVYEALGPGYLELVTSGEFPPFDSQVSAPTGTQGIPPPPNQLAYGTRYVIYHVYFK